MSYAVVNPATGETVTSYPTISDADLDAAIAAAAAAHRDWSRTTTPEERAALVRRVGDLHAERRDELAAIIVREMGKPLEQALGEVDFAADIYGYYADISPEVLRDEPVKLLAGEGTAVIRRNSLGVLLGIMPWNFPYYQVARFAGPNLVIGNTIVLKHAEQCPESAAAIAQIFHDAGFPEGAYVNVYASNEQIERIIADRRVQGVSLTGSERAGAAVAEIAGRNLKKVVLELGGSDPFILLSHRRPRQGRGGCRGRPPRQHRTVLQRRQALHRGGGALRRLPREVHGRARGGPAERSELRGQQARPAVVGRRGRPPRRTSSTARSPAAPNCTPPASARATTSRPRSSPGSRPTTTPTTRSSSARWRPSTRSARSRRPSTLANDIPFGLGSYVFTTDPEQAERVANSIEAGMVFVNVVGADGVELPFGGVKRSGFGRELGRLGADEFVNKKLIRIG